MSETTTRILVMDDESAIRTLVVTILSRSGCEVVEAKDGDEAISLYREAMQTDRPFQLVILDLRVPGGRGGADALAEIRQLTPDALAIASTGSTGASAQDPEHAPDLSVFDAYLAKPYSISELREVVHELLTSRTGEGA